MGVATAVLALAIAGVLTWKRKAPKTVALLAVVAGAGLSSGFVGDMLASGVRGATSLVGSLTSAAFGVAVPTILAVVGLIVFVHDIWPGHKASRLTAGIGLVLPTLVTFVGGAIGSLSTSAVNGLGTAVSHVLMSLFGTGGA